MQARVSFLLTPLLRSFAGTKLMMRNLPWAASKDEVTNAVKALVSFEKLDLPVNLDGRNRGFGFVTFATEADKDKATATLAALEIGGRKVSVHEYVETPRGERPPRTGGFQERRPRFDSEGRPPRNFRGPQGGEGGNPSS
jgi:RNA recognition motif-containing protein